MISVCGRKSVFGCNIFGWYFGVAWRIMIRFIARSIGCCFYSLSNLVDTLLCRPKFVYFSIVMILFFHPRRHNQCLLQYESLLGLHHRLPPNHFRNQSFSPHSATSIAVTAQDHQLVPCSSSTAASFASIRSMALFLHCLWLWPQRFAVDEYFCLWPRQYSILDIINRPFDIYHRACWRLNSFSFFDQSIQLPHLPSSDGFCLLMFRSSFISRNVFVVIVPFLLLSLVCNFLTLGFA